MANGQEKIYILLMRSRTFVSRIVGRFTKGIYTHSSLSFDKDCTDMYSFARIYKKTFVPGGFIRESIHRGVIKDCKKEPCILYELDLDESTYNRIRKEVDHFRFAKKRPSYDFLGAFRCYRGHANEQSRRYFCSRFVAQVLGAAGAISLKKPASLYLPDDFTKQSELKPVYKGDMQGLRVFLAGKTPAVL